VEAPASESAVVPPELASPASVAYPERATGDAVVVLALTIDADGNVRQARAVQGDDPFAKAAVEAALSWRFSPATRAGKPVASIIRFEVTFHAPVASGEPPPAPSTPKPPEPPRGSATATRRATAPVEVQVRGDRPAPTVSSFARAEVRQLPGAFGDPFRAIEALPGVTPIVSGLPFFYVRGAPPGNVGYFLDGIRVPYLYHVGLGPSVIHPAMVERVDLYPGGYPARFGRFAGGIVSGETTAPRDDLHGEGNIRLFDVGALAETGFAGGRGTVLLGGRYSYTAAIVSLIAKNVTLDYRDYQARATYDLSPSDRITAVSFGSYDLLGQTKNGILNVAFGSEFYRLDLRYDHSFGSGSTVRYGVTLGYDQTRVADQRNSQDRSVSTRVEIRHPVSKTVVIRGGADTTLDGFGEDRSSYVDPDDPTLKRFDALFAPRSDLALGAWVDAVLDVAPRVQVTPGVRVDVFTSGGAAAPAVDPRVSARFAITDHFRIVHAYGIAHQPPSFVVPIPGLVPGKLSGGLQTSLQTSAGIEADLPEDITVTASVFDNLFFNMSDVLGTTTGDLADTLDQRARGSAQGFELFVRRRLTKRLAGFVTYTLSRSTRTLNGRTFPSAFDRTHVANAALAYDLGKHWRAGTRLVFYTGNPVVVETRGAIPLPPSQSPSREPAFYRLDFRVEKRWNIGKSGWLAFVAEFLNATLNKEYVRSEPIGPVSIPSLGLEGGF
jgi:TonB family protein